LVKPFSAQVSRPQLVCADTNTLHLRPSRVANNTASKTNAVGAAGAHVYRLHHTTRASVWDLKCLSPPPISTFFTFLSTFCSEKRLLGLFFFWIWPTRTGYQCLCVCVCACVCGHGAAHHSEEGQGEGEGSPSADSVGCCSPVATLTRIQQQQRCKFRVVYFVVCLCVCLPTDDRSPTFHCSAIADPARRLSQLPQPSWRNPCACRGVKSSTTHEQKLILNLANTTKMQRPAMLTSVLCAWLRS
jgi:hypothetical protein